MLFVQILALLGLIRYVKETIGLRKAAPKQIEVSQKLLEAATDQVEGLARPCLTLASELRDGDGTILELDGARGSTRARTKDAHFVFQNIGNGLGLNVHYSFRPINQVTELR